MSGMPYELDMINDFIIRFLNLQSICRGAFKVLSVRKSLERINKLNTFMKVTGRPSSLLSHFLYERLVLNDFQAVQLNDFR